MDTKVYFANIQSQVISHINSSKTTMRAAIAWFTDDSIYRAVVAAVQRGVKVEIILLADDINRNSGLDFRGLERVGASIYWYDATVAGLMHHKFCVIDSQICLTGSYNWTSRAAYSNLENLTVIIDSGTAREFTKEFLYLREELGYNPEVSLMQSSEVSTKEVIVIMDDEEEIDEVETNKVEMSQEKIDDYSSHNYYDPSEDNTVEIIKVNSNTVTVNTLREDDYGYEIGNVNIGIKRFLDIFVRTCFKKDKDDDHDGDKVRGHLFLLSKEDLKDYQNKLDEDSHLLGVFDIEDVHDLVGQTFNLNEDDFNYLLMLRI